MRKESFIGLIAGFVLLVTFLLPGVQSSMAYEKQIQSLSAFMAGKIAAAGKKSIAVVDFTDLQGNVTELGRFLAEEFSVALAGASKGFEVIDRTHLKSIMAEHKLASTGIIDPQTARKLGKIAGVGALITGTITPFGDSIRLSVKVLDTETAKMISASTGNIAKTDAINELLKRGITPASTTAPGVATPVVTAQGAKGKRTFESKGFVLCLTSCRISDKEVRCSFTITNTYKKERMAALESDSYLYDDAGNFHKPYRLFLGGSGGPVTFTATRFRSTLIPNVPENGALIFKDVQRQTKYVTVGIVMSDGIKAVFRNIPITK